MTAYHVIYHGHILFVFVHAICLGNRAWRLDFFGSLAVSWCLECAVASHGEISLHREIDRPQWPSPVMPGIKLRFP